MWTIDDMPRRRLECVNKKRPCPWIRCKYHLIWPLWNKLRDRSDDKVADYITEMKYSCILDAIDDYGEMTLEQIGQLFHITRERIRQIEEKAVRRVLKPTRERAPILANLKDSLIRLRHSQ